jgi:hypothetical protein
MTDLAAWKNTLWRGPRGTSCAPFRESTHAMNKRQLIDGIRQLNQTAQPEFLAQFDDEALQQYLRHLQSAQEKRLKVAGWVKSIPKPRFRMVS